MKNKLRDFIEMFTFGVVLFTLTLIAIQVVMNLVNYVSEGKPISLEFNLRLFFSLEILIISLSTLISLIYVYAFNNYKNIPDDK